MKQTILMVALTLVGAFGAFTAEPFVGVAVYYLFAVLRPQFLWKWALPPDISWSEFVAWATIVATVWFVLTSPADGSTGTPRRRFAPAHIAFLTFGIWISLTYLTAISQYVAWPFLLEYLKIFVMFAVATVALRNLRQVRQLYLICTVSLIYIAYEMNFQYFMAGRLDIYHNGYGGLDNNGAALMLAMGIPLALQAWESSRQKWRWLFLAGVPLIIHAVLMSYSRGAMLSLIVSVPFLVLRSTRRKQFAFVLLLLIAAVPFLAGKEIQARFFTIERYDADASAQGRLDSWRSAVSIANRYPVFGAGIRNHTLLTFKYGADVQGRVIHSQYLTMMADAGYPGLFLYLVYLATTFFSVSATRRALKRHVRAQGDNEETRLLQSMLNGIEGSLFVFCVGASFLALETFELPYIIVLLGAQMSLLIRARLAEAPQPAVAPHAPPFPVAPQRA